MNDNKKTFKETPEHLKETASIELKDIVGAFSRSSHENANSPKALLAAKRLIDHIIHYQGSYRLDKEVIAPFLSEIYVAAGFASDGYKAEVEAYEKKFNELLRDGKTNEEAKRRISDYEIEPVNESMHALIRMIEEGFIDLKREPWTRSFVAERIKKELLDKTQKSSLGSMERREIAVLARSYKESGILDEKKDADLFDALEKSK
mgnify:CR=1 FL=1